MRLVPAAAMDLALLLFFSISRTTRGTSEASRTDT